MTDLQYVRKPDFHVEDQLDFMMSEWSIGNRHNVVKCCINEPVTTVMEFCGRLVSYSGHHALTELIRLIKAEQKEKK